MLNAAQVVIAALFALAYLLRSLTLRSSGQAPERWRVCCMLGGVAIVIAAVVALESEGKRMLYLATIEQLLIGDVATLLIALSLTSPLLACFGRLPLAGRLRVVLCPTLALSLWTVNMAIWHLPGPFEFALDHRSAMLLQHLLLAGLGVATWVSLIGPYASERWRGKHGRWTFYALFWRALAVALGVGGIVSPIVFYSHYISYDVEATMSPLTDQGIAGSTLIGESALAAIGLLIWLYIRTGSEAASKQTPPPPPTTPSLRGGDPLAVKT